MKKEWKWMTLLLIAVILTSTLSGCIGGKEETPTPTTMPSPEHEVELIVFVAEWCKASPKAIDIVKEIAESSEFINYRVIKYEEEPEEFESFGIDLNGLPITAVIIDGEITDVLDGAFKLDSRIVEAIENATEISLTIIPPSTTTPTPTTTTPAPTQPTKYSYVDPDAGILFEYPSYLTLDANPEGEDNLAILRNEDVTIVIKRNEAGYPIKEYTDSVINYFSKEYPPCEVMQRVKMHLGEEIGERIVLQYTQNEIKQIRFSLSANHKGYRYGVWLFTTLPNFDKYIEDAEEIMDSFKFLSTVPESEEGIKSIKIGEITSYYTYSNLEKGSKTEINITKIQDLFCCI